MARLYPENFNSFEEYDTYFTCIKKVRAGDKVEAYFRNSGDGLHCYKPSSYRTPITKEIHVAGIRREGKDKFGIVLILGTDEKDIGFYRPEGRLDSYVPNFPYRYMYYGFVRDIKFSKIIKAR